MGEGFFFFVIGFGVAVPTMLVLFATREAWEEREKEQAKDRRTLSGAVSEINNQRITLNSIVERVSALEDRGRAQVVSEKYGGGSIDIGQ